ncbi:hypothetical protein [Halosolutus gelatinilyticus]|uniref:hypothetical protein n=1 Tax=Halosolutus gelatinilyticus TaxID=2931975 RepID=UPI001FF5BDC8|nr:hypothetical protein [Halosolutus gelatinilyticus]
MTKPAEPGSAAQGGGTDARVSPDAAADRRPRVDGVSDADPVPPQTARERDGAFVRIDSNDYD